MAEKSSFKGEKSSLKLFGKIEFPSKRTKKPAIENHIGKENLLRFKVIKSLNFKKAKKRSKTFIDSTGMEIPCHFFAWYSEVNIYVLKSSFFS